MELGRLRFYCMNPNSISAYHLKKNGSAAPLYIILIFEHYPESVYRQIIKLPLDNSKVLYLESQTQMRRSHLAYTLHVQGLKIRASELVMDRLSEIWFLHPWISTNHQCKKQIQLAFSPLLKATSKTRVLKTLSITNQSVGNQ